MPSLVQRYYWTCIKVLCEWINSHATTITYGELAGQLGLKLARQEWNGLLDLIAGKARRELGDDYDVTWIVVYAQGPAKGLSRYFSQSDVAPGSNRKLEQSFKYTYTLETEAGATTIIKHPR